MIRFDQAMPIAGEQLPIAHMSEEYFILCMSRAFNEFPVTLTEKDVDKLLGMGACWAETAANPYMNLAKQVKRLGSVKVWQTQEK